MRYLVLVLFAAALSSSGCSMMMVHCGTDLRELSTREQVHAKFGAPVEEGVIKGQAFDELVTHRKVYDPSVESRLFICWVWTYGLLEFVAFPASVYKLGHDTVVGQRLRFEYTADGRVERILVAGEPYDSGTFH